MATARALDLLRIAAQGNASGAARLQTRRKRSVGNPARVAKPRRVNLPIVCGPPSAGCPAGGRGFLPELYRGDVLRRGRRQFRDQANHGANAAVTCPATPTTALEAARRRTGKRCLRYRSMENHNDFHHDELLIARLTRCGVIRSSASCRRIKSHSWRPSCGTRLRTLPCNAN